MDLPNGGITGWAFKYDAQAAQRAHQYQECEEENVSYSEILLEGCMVDDREDLLHDINGHLIGR